MKVYRAKLQALLDEWPDDEAQAAAKAAGTPDDAAEGDKKPPEGDAKPKEGEGNGGAENADKGDTSETPEAKTGENKMEPATAEKTEVQAPQVPARTTITAEEMEAENLEKQVAAFALKQTDFQTALNVCIERIAKLEQMVLTFDKALDVAAQTSVHAVDVNAAVNLL